MELLKNDETAQIKGVVRIMYEVGRTFSQIRSQTSFKDRMDSIKMYQDCLPMRIASFHFCHNEPKLHAGLRMFLGLATKENRVRFRVHYGKQARKYCELNLQAMRADECMPVYAYECPYTENVRCCPYGLFPCRRSR